MMKSNYNKNSVLNDIVLIIGCFDICFGNKLTLRIDKWKSELCYFGE